MDFTEVVQAKRDSIIEQVTANFDTAGIEAVEGVQGFFGDNYLFADGSQYEFGDVTNGTALTRAVWDEYKNGGGNALDQPYVEAVSLETRIAEELDIAITEELGYPTIIILNVPDGATLSDGVDNGDGGWLVTMDQLTNLTITPPDNSDEDFFLVVSGVTQADLDVAQGELDVAELIVAQEFINARTISTELSDALVFFSERPESTYRKELLIDQLEVWVSEEERTLPDGLADLIANAVAERIPDGVYQNKDNFVAAVNLVIPVVNESWVASKEAFETIDVAQAIVDGGVIDGETINVVVDAVADKPTLEIPDNNTVFEGQPIALNISAALTDTDGSEFLSSVVLFNFSFIGVFQEQMDVALVEYEEFKIDTGDGEFAYGVELWEQDATNNEDAYIITYADLLDAESNISVMVNMISVNTSGGSYDFGITNSSRQHHEMNNEQANQALRFKELSEIIANENILTYSEGTYSVENNSLTLTADELSKVSMTASKLEDNPWVSFKVIATSEEKSNGNTADSDEYVGYFAVEKLPSLIVGDVSGDEDIAIDLDIEASLDVDFISIVNWSLLPDGTILSGGSLREGNAEEWFIERSYFEGFTISAPEHWSGYFRLKTKAYNESGGFIETQYIAVTVDPVADEPTLLVNDTSGWLNQAIELDIFAALTDSSERLTIAISGVPEGSTLSESSYDQSLDIYYVAKSNLDKVTITPPADFTGDFTLTIEVTSTEDSNGSSKMVSDDIVVLVEEQPLLMANDIRGDEGTAINFDMLFSPEVRSFRILEYDTLPEGIDISYGSNDFTENTWVMAKVPANDYNDLFNDITITPPEYYSGSFSLILELNTHTDYEYVSTPPMTITVDPVADEPTLMVVDVEGYTNEPIALDISAALKDDDGSESLSINISGVPDGADLSNGTDNQDGSWTLTAEQLTGLTVTPPENSTFDFHLDVTATSTETDGGGTAIISETLDISSLGPNDIRVSDISGVAGETIPVSIKIGSNVTMVKLWDVPSGFTASVGAESANSQNNENSWYFHDFDRDLFIEMLKDFTITIPEGLHESLVLSVQVSKTGNAGAYNDTIFPITIVDDVDGVPNIDYVSSDMPYPPNAAPSIPMSDSEAQSNQAMPNSDSEALFDILKSNRASETDLNPLPDFEARLESLTDAEVAFRSLIETNSSSVIETSLIRVFGSLDHAKSIMELLENSATEANRENYGTVDPYNGDSASEMSSFDDLVESFSSDVEHDDYVAFEIGSFVDL